MILRRACPGGYKQLNISRQMWWVDVLRFAEQLHKKDNWVLDTSATMVSYINLRKHQVNKVHGESLQSQIRSRWKID